jgi:putative sigma-54 modulation protein
MAMKITGRHLTVTPALRRHIEAKFERFARYDVVLNRVDIVLSVNKLQHSAEAVCTVAGRRLQAKTSTREMYATIDQLVERLEAQIRKHKERQVEHKGKKRTAVALRPPQPGLGGEEVEVVRPVPSVLSLDEAKRRLNRQVGSLIVFTSSESGKLQILQRVESDRVVLIDP